MLNDFSLFLHIMCNNVCVKVARRSARTCSVCRPASPPARGAPAAPAGAAAEPEEAAGILAESSAWEAATNALDAEEIKAQGGTDWGVGRGPAKGRGPRRSSSGTDWGVGRGSAKSAAARTRSPWPAAVRALVGDPWPRRATPESCSCRSPVVIHPAPVATGTPYRAGAQPCRPPARRRR